MVWGVTKKERERQASVRTASSRIYIQQAASIFRSTHPNSMRLPKFLPDAPLGTNPPRFHVPRNRTAWPRRSMHRTPSSPLHRQREEPPKEHRDNRGTAAAAAAANRCLRKPWRQKLSLPESTQTRPAPESPTVRRPAPRAPRSRTSRTPCQRRILRARRRPRTARPLPCCRAPA